VLVAALFLFTLALGGCQRNPHEVAVIEKTKSYHRPECNVVMMANARYCDMTPQIAHDYKRCPYCKPDTL